MTGGRRTGVGCAATALATLALAAGAGSAPAAGPLRVLPSNPRYFADATGKPVYLTGSHVWWNLVGGTSWGRCLGLAPATFSYPGYLATLRAHGHNFFRLWAIELIRWQECGTFVSVDLHPWPRTGPGLAADGRPRFDLTQLDPAYFARLRERVAAAQLAGVYVSVMLFESWSVQFEEGGWGWTGNPFNPANNVNQISGDRNGDGLGDDVHTLSNPAVVAAQDRYVRKVVDTLNSFDNVLYEVANEASAQSTAWQYHMIDLVKGYERLKPKRHPVGMTYQHGDFTNATLLASRADWISPYGDSWLNDPPPADGRKVLLLDTDHLCGICGGFDWVWKSFTRGYNPIYMDPLDLDAERIGARLAMGRARRLALSTDLARLRPRVDLSSTRYCMAQPRVQYVVYQPGTERFWLDVGRAGTYRGVWTNARDGRDRAFGPRRLSGRAELTAPWREPAVLRLRRWTPPRR